MSRIFWRGMAPFLLVFFFLGFSKVAALPAGGSDPWASGRHDVPLNRVSADSASREHHDASSAQGAGAQHLSTDPNFDQAPSSQHHYPDWFWRSNAWISPSDQNSRPDSSWYQMPRTQYHQYAEEANRPPIRLMTQPVPPPWEAGTSHPHDGPGAAVSISTLMHAPRADVGSPQADRLGSLNSAAITVPRGALLRASEGVQEQHVPSKSTTAGSSVSPKIVTEMLPHDLRYQQPGSNSHSISKSSASTSMQADADPEAGSTAPSRNRYSMVPDLLDTIPKTDPPVVSKQFRRHSYPYIEDERLRSVINDRIFGGKLNWVESKEISNGIRRSQRDLANKANRVLPYVEDLEEGGSFEPRQIRLTIHRAVRRGQAFHQPIPTGTYYAVWSFPKLAKNQAVIKNIGVGYLALEDVLRVDRHLQEMRELGEYHAEVMRKSLLP